MIRALRALPTRPSKLPFLLRAARLRTELLGHFYSSATAAAAAPAMRWRHRNTHTATAALEVHRRSKSLSRRSQINLCSTVDGGRIRSPSARDRCPGRPLILVASRCRLALGLLDAPRSSVRYSLIQNDEYWLLRSGSQWRSHTFWIGDSNGHDVSLFQYQFQCLLFTGNF